LSNADGEKQPNRLDAANMTRVQADNLGKTLPL